MALEIRWWSLRCILCDGIFQLDGVPVDWSMSIMLRTGPFGDSTIHIVWTSLAKESVLSIKSFVLYQGEGTADTFREFYMQLPIEWKRRGWDNDPFPSTITMFNMTRSMLRHPLPEFPSMKPAIYQTACYIGCSCWFQMERPRSFHSL